MVSQFVSHSTYLLIALVAVALILATFSSFRSNVEKVSIESSLNIIADTVKQEILKLYSSSDESGKFEIPLQSRLGEKPFVISLSQNKISVSLDDFLVEKNITISANLTGTASLPAFLVMNKIGDSKTISLVEA